MGAAAIEATGGTDDEVSKPRGEDFCWKAGKGHGDIFGSIFKFLAASLN